MHEKKKNRKWDQVSLHFSATFDWFIHLSQSLLFASGLSQVGAPQTPNGQLRQIDVSLSHLLSPYVGQSMCIDIFSVYGSPESRIGDHPRNRLSHFNAPWKWSSHVVSSISLFIAGSPPFTPLSETIKSTSCRTGRCCESHNWQWLLEWEGPGQELHQHTRT